MKKNLVSILASAIVAASLAPSAMASSHREAPNVTRMPAVDSTDFYLFNSYEEGRGDYVTMIANYIPLQDAYGGPNYFAMDPAAVYAIHIDNDGDAVEDLTFSFRFTQALGGADGQGVELPIGAPGEEVNVGVPLKHVGIASNFSETYSLEVSVGAFGSSMASKASNAADGSMTFAKPLDNIGDKTAQFLPGGNYEAYANMHIFNATVQGCDMPVRVFAGQRKDPFTVNLGKTFDLVNYVPVELGVLGEGVGIAQDVANDDLADKNVTALAIEVHKDCVTGDGNGVIGAWTAAYVPQARIHNPNAAFNNVEANGGALTQVSRLSNPLVNEVVIGLADKDTFSSSHPSQDGQFAKYVTNPTLPILVDVLFLDAVNGLTGADFETLSPTNYPRLDLVTAFLTGFPGVNQMSTVTPSEMLRLNTGIPATPQMDQHPLGVAAADLAGFPNGRRPGDDTVDIALRAVMGVLCHDLPLGPDGSGVNLGLCAPEDAPVGTVPFTDGAPSNAMMMSASFPYLATPLSGSTN